MESIPTTPNVCENQDQPVTRAVIIWVLLSLAISSMSRPGGCIVNIPRKHRIYMCGSPLICAADALSMLAAILLTTCRLHVSLSKAARFVVAEKFRRRSDDEGEISEWPERSRFPRWVFFIIGTLPAFIQLMSFSGMPWTQIWGSMFGFSYLIIEILIMLVAYDGHEVPTSSFEALGCSADRMAMDVNQTLREESESVQTWKEVLDLLFFLVALLGQAALTAWTLSSIWHPVTEMEVNVPFKLYIVWQLVVLTFSIVVVAGWFWLIICWVVVPLIRRTWPPEPASPLWTRISPLQLIVISWFLSTRGLAPRAKHVSNQKTDPTWQQALWLLFLVVVLIKTLQRILRVMCKRLPRFGEWLSVKVEVRDTSEESAPLNEDETDSDGSGYVICLLLHLSITVTWYAIRYNPSGTVNPSWTDVFGT